LIEEITWATTNLIRFRVNSTSYQRYQTGAVSMLKGVFKICMRSILLEERNLFLSSYFTSIIKWMATHPLEAITLALFWIRLIKCVMAASTKISNLWPMDRERNAIVIHASRTIWERKSFILSWNETEICLRELKNSSSYWFVHAISNERMRLS